MDQSYNKIMSDILKDDLSIGVGRKDFGVNRPPVSLTSEPKAKPADDPEVIALIARLTKPTTDALRKARLGEEDFRQRTEGVAHPSQIQSDQTSARLGELQKPTESSRNH
jgi:hypothetical protein